MGNADFFFFDCFNNHMKMTVKALKNGRLCVHYVRTELPLDKKKKKKISLMFKILELGYPADKKTCQISCHSYFEASSILP